MNWRPKGWKIPETNGLSPPLVQFLSSNDVLLYEAGADAMLEALNKIAREHSYSIVKSEKTGKRIKFVYLPEEVVDAT